jgi:hypothetical protein
MQEERTAGAVRARCALGPGSLWSGGVWGEQQVQ